jgi:hypothetical protein
MFFDESKIRKVNLGDKKVTNKDEFLKKIKAEKTKELEITKITESNKIIANFMKKNKGKFYKSESFVNVQKKLKSILMLLKTKRDLDDSKREKVVLVINFSRSYV